MRRALAGAALLTVIAAAPVAAQSEAELLVRRALANWTNDFNRGDASHICDLFAPDLRYDYRSFPERGYADICALLKKSLADRTRTYTYALDIREVIVSGDLVIVRLVWTLQIRAAGSDKVIEQSKEPGLDVFRRQPSGMWKIARYIAYEAPP